MDRRLVLLIYPICKFLAWVGIGVCSIPDEELFCNVSFLFASGGGERHLVGTIYASSSIVNNSKRKSVGEL